MPYSATIRYEGTFNLADGEEMLSKAIFAQEIPTLLRVACDWAIYRAGESYSPMTIHDVQVVSYGEGQD